MPKYYDRNKTAGPKNLPQNTSGASQKYLDWQAQQAELERIRAQELKRKQLEAARANARRLAQQSAQQAEAARKRSVAEAKAQYQYNRKVQRKTHTVTVNDTPESIAKKYGVLPSVVASLVPRLRPGQKLNIPVVGQGAGTAAPAAPLPFEQGQNNQQPLLPRYSMPPWAQRVEATFKDIFRLTPTVKTVLGRLAIAAGSGTKKTPWFDPEREQFTEWGQNMLTQGQRELQQENVKYYGYEVPRADLSQYNELRRIPGGIHDQMTEEINTANLEKGAWMSGMRYTGQALSYAYEAMTNGDPNWRRYLENSDGEVVMAITDGRWDTGPMKEQFSQDMWNKIEEMGFTEIEDGLWMMPVIEPPDYGMGGYTFPGFGGGYGGVGGGGYEYLSRGGVFKRKVGGGKSQKEAYRIFAEGVPPAHWRI